MQGFGKELAGTAESWSRTAARGSLWADLCKLHDKLHSKLLFTQSQSKQQHHFPSMTQTELIQPVHLPFMTYLHGVQPWETLLSPPPTPPPRWLHSWNLLLPTVTPYSCFILETRNPALQPQDNCWSQNPQPRFVQSALAAFNVEPLSCCKRFNKFFLQSLHNALGLKEQSSRACYFPGLFVDLSL